MLHNTALAAIAALTLTTAGAPCAEAKDAWPVHTITLVQPYVPGGTSDMLAQILAKALEQRIDAQVIVESKAGANGTVAASWVSRATPDGSVFLVGSSSPVVIAPALRRTPYDPVQDLTPISPLAKAPFLLVSSPKSGIHSVKELLAQAQAQTGTLHFGSAGAGTPQHVVAEMFHKAAKIKTRHVPYKGSAPLAVAVVANEVQYAFDNPVPLMPAIAAGKLRVLATTSKHASAQFPGVKSLQELGYSRMDVEPWYGMFGAKGLPKELAERMNRYVQDILAQDSVRQQIGDLGAEVYGLSTTDFAKLVHTDLKKWAADVKASGATAR